MAKGSIINPCMGGSGGRGSSKTRRNFAWGNTFIQRPDPDYSCCVPSIESTATSITPFWTYRWNLFLDVNVHPFSLFLHVPPQKKNSFVTNFYYFWSRLFFNNRAHDYNFFFIIILYDFYFRDCHHYYLILHLGFSFNCRYNKKQKIQL